MSSHTALLLSCITSGNRIMFYTADAQTIGSSHCTGLDSFSETCARGATKTRLFSAYILGLVHNEPQGGCRHQRTERFGLEK